MNSIFIDPAIEEKTRKILSDQLRQTTNKRRVEAEVWQTEDITDALRTALEHTSPTLIAVGSRAWLDRIITTTGTLTDSLPVFGHIPFTAIRHSPLIPFLLRRTVTTAVAALAARKVSHIPLFSVNDALFTESCSFGQDETIGTFSLKLALDLHDGQILLNTQASRIDISLLEALHGESSLLRLSVKSELLSKPTDRVKAAQILPANRTTLPTNRYEEALHLSIQQGKVTGAQPLISLSHRGLKPDPVLTIKTISIPLRFITPKNQPQRY